MRRIRIIDVKEPRQTGWRGSDRISSHQLESNILTLLTSLPAFSLRK